MIVLSLQLPDLSQDLEYFPDLSQITIAISCSHLQVHTTMLEDLPLDMLLVVLQFVDCLALAALSRTSHRLKDAAEKYSEMWINRIATTQTNGEIVTKEEMAKFREDISNLQKRLEEKGWKMFEDVEKEMPSGKHPLGRNRFAVGKLLGIGGFGR